MYAYEYGLKKFDEKYQPFGHVTVFNDDIQIIKENTQQTTNQGVYVKVTLNPDGISADIILDDFKQYSSRVFEEYLIHINAYTNNGETRNINGFPNQINRPIVIFNGDYYANVIDVVELEEVVITAKRPEYDELSDQAKKIIKKRQKLEPVFADIEEQLKAANTSVIMMISHDGAKLERAYQKMTTVLDNEIIMFVENGNGFNFTGSVFRITSGKGITENTSVPFQLLAKLCKIYNVEIDRSKIVKLIKNHLEDKDSNILYYIRKGLQILNTPATWTLDGVSWVLDKLTEGVNYVRVDDINKWKAYDENGQENPNFDPFLFGYEQIKALQKTAEKFNYNKVFAGFNSKIDFLEEKLVDGIEAIKIPGLVKFAKRKLSGVFFLLRNIKNFVKKAVSIVLKTMEKGFLFINAFVIGIYNSLVDMVTGILQLVSLICKGVSGAIKFGGELVENGSTYFSMFLEFFENGIETLAGLFSRENMNAFMEFKINMVKNIVFMLMNPLQTVVIAGELAKNKASTISFSAEQIGYGVGYVIGFIITEILLAIATGGAKTVGTALQVAAKGYVSLLKGVLSIPKILVKGVIKVKNFTVDIFFGLFKLIRSAVRNFPKLLQKIANWFNEVLSVSKNFVIETFNKLFPTKAARDKITAAGFKPSSATDNFITFCPIK
jgi:hypothetical protein